MVHGLYKGIRLNVAIKNQLGIILYPNEVYLQNFLRKNLSSGDIAFDIGSNIGYTSILSSKIVGHAGHVYSFEPIEENVRILNKNIELNNCKNISIINKALSNKNEDADIFIPDNGRNLSMSSIVWGKKSHTAKKEIIKTISIDQDSNFKNLSPRTIKIDVEGAEGLVVEGMQKLISRCRPYIYIECTNIGRETTWNILKSLNYSCFLAQEYREEIVDFSLYKSNDFIWAPNYSYDLS